ncbi:amino acid adenylation domain-containing protein [Rhizobium sp. TRM95111]|uniref:non-ribosomal peptide synthetase n=1 Tax=Rhizobium alarense TaxID=2846851 RepID=UPI001F38569D|nr:non-ribosomal peptide synthetase [Rhizobium alarense]MCF3639292.1 amino acid adenylation domain-containing protein [Rhizobium alarense]
MSKFPLVGTQLGIWFADQLASEKNTFAIAHAVDLSCDIDVALLKEAILHGLGEADTVTAHYFEDEAGQWQRIRNRESAEGLPPVELIDLGAEDDPAQAARALMDEDLRQDLPVTGDRALCRQVIFSLGRSAGGPAWIWYQRYHHIMLDGFSFTALTRRIADIYSLRRRGEAVGPSPFGSVAEVVAEEQSYPVSPDFAKDRAFWSAHCAQLPAPASLSSRIAGSSPQGAAITAYAKTLPSDHLRQLQEKASAHGVAVFDLLTAAVAAYLYRLSGSAAQAIGVPFMRRMGSAAINATVPVVNVLPVLAKVDGRRPLPALAGSVKAALRQARRHQRYDAERILRDLGIVGSGRPLYGPVVNYRMFDYDLHFGDVRGATRHLATGPVDDIEFGILIHDDAVTLEMRGAGALYGEADLAQHASRLVRVINAFLTDETIAVDALPVMAEDEAEQLALLGSGPRVEQSPPLTTIVDVFVRQAAATPDATALVFGERSLNFTTLAADVFRLARHLMAGGIGPGDIVAVALPRTEQPVVAMLGVLASGASYMPLDLDYPAERLAMMCEDARPRLVITDKAHAATLPPGTDSLCIDNPDIVYACGRQDAGPITIDERKSPLSATTIAHVIFTSGSTGRPKGVINSHGALLNLFLAHGPTIYRPALDAFARRHPDRTLRAAHTHSFAFDSSWLQIFWMLHGQELHVLEDDLRRDAERLAEAIGMRRIDALDLPPSFCTQLFACGLMAPERHEPTVLLIGGEAASPSLWRSLRHYPALHAHNLYGPTEFTVDALHAPLAIADHPVIGRPIGNGHAYVLDARLRPVPIGVAGELYLSGSGLAEGYIGRPDLTAQRFVPDPTRPGERMYRTGDRVRWNEQGTIEFLGRNDQQIKVRGYRIEVAEIETALTDLPEVATALVVAEPLEGSHRLIAYCTIVAQTGMETVTAERLRNDLRNRLPDYMLPAAIVLLDTLPLTVNGKVDRARLPAPSVAVERQPTTREEILICSAMARVLRLPAVGLEHDFFALGGDSITAITLCTALRADGLVLRPRDIFAERDARRMARVAKAAAMDQQTGAATTPTVSEEEWAALQARYGAVDDVVPTLVTQRGMLFHAALGDRAGSYNAFSRLDLEGRLDVDRLRRAFDAVLRKHPQLGGVFDMDGRDEPLLVVPAFAPGASCLWPWEEHDLSRQQAHERGNALDRIVASAVERSHFGPAYGRLLSATLVHLSDEMHVLVVVIHHLMIDGWSTPLLLRDLLDAYRDDGEALPPVQRRYGDVVRHLAARDPAPSRAHWQAVLQGVMPTLLFDRAMADGTVEEHEFRLPETLTEALLSRARRQGITLNVLMQAVWAMVLSSMSGRDDVVFGTPVAGRSAPIDGIGNQIGLFLNTIPVRVDLRPDVSLWAQAETIQTRHAVLMEHDALGLAEIQTMAGGKPLFDTLLVVENYPDSDYLGLDIDGLAVTGIHNRGYSHYPLALLVLPGRELTLLIESRGAVDDAQAVAERVAALLEALILDPEQPVATLPVRSARDRALVTTVNATDQTLPSLTLRDLLLAQAGRTPDAVALQDETGTLTFREVRRQALHLAARLRRQGVCTGDIVAVALPRSARLSIALLAVIEAGAAFLPLDLGYPDDRLAFMLADAAPRVIVTDSRSVERLGSRATTVLFDELCGSAAEVRDVSGDGLGSTSPAYVLYTSGTTGRPKGAVVSHGAIVNRILWMQSAYPLDGTDVVLQKTPCGFDVSVWEFFWSYVVGARLVMAPPDAHRDPSALIGLIERHAVTTLHFVPSMLAVFLAAAREAGPAAVCRSMRRVFCSGEALAKGLARDFSDLFDAELHNLYGPTEAAIDVTFAPAAGDLVRGSGSVPIGLPVWNTQLRILDHLLRPVGIGVAGELYLSGVQLALGYLGRPDLTAGRFVADPFATGQRMYRTGDVARWLPDGQVEYLGRTDHQIKIRGQRVELGEIEAHIEKVPGIRQAVVQAVQFGKPGLQGADERQLVAYLVQEPGLPATLDTIGARLRAVLPAHMVPVTFMALDALPLSPNGKLDRKALPLPATAGAASSTGRPPAEGLESRIATIFSDLLGRDAVGADEDFFAIGGHSLLAMRLAARIRRELKRQVSVGQIMIMPTVAKLAEHLLAGELVGDMAKGGFEPVIRLRDGSGPPLICIYPASGVSWQYSVLSRYLHPAMPIIGLQSPRPNGPIAVSASLDEACDRQLAVLRGIQPEGPYYLLGYSLGGTIAYGLAVRLRRMGETVRFLGLLDTYPSEEHDWSDPDGAQADLGAEREQEQFINDAMADVMDDDLRREKEEMFGHIFDNYRDSVRLLSRATTPDYDGHVTLFVAGRSVPPGIDPDRCWLDRVASLSVHRLSHCSHEDIVSPASLEILGPLLNALVESASREAAPGTPSSRQAAE